MSKASSSIVIDRHKLGIKIISSFDETVAVVVVRLHFNGNIFLSTGKIEACFAAILDT